jgi:hypothetical protein
MTIIRKARKGKFMNILLQSVNTVAAYRSTGTGVDVKYSTRIRLLETSLSAEFQRIC